MKKIILAFTVLSVCAPAFAADCFTSRQQRYTYEQGLCAAQENEQITSCLKDNISSADTAAFNDSVSALRKSNNLRTVLPAVMAVFKTSKDPQAVFNAAVSLASAAGDTEIYQRDLLNILSAPQAQDYKKTLAVIVLVSMDEADPDYINFLTPALNAKDPALAAYACAAYSILSPGTLDKYLSSIVELYAFDKVFAQKAFDATGLKEKALTSKLQENLYSPAKNLRLSAIEWIGDLGNKKLLLALLEPSVDPKEEASTLSASANALVKNYALVQDELKKTLKKDPSTQASTVAVMAYSFLGSAAYPVVEPLLQSGNDNETANALRIVSSVAGILGGDAAFYPNPALEKERLIKLIPVVAKVNKNAYAPKVKVYAQAASKELYKFLNAK